MNHARALPLHRPLAVLAVGAGVLAVVLLPAMVLDDRQLLGVSVLRKPWKLAVSIALYALTMAWMVTLVRRGARLARAAATGAAVALGIEMAIITVQAARGVPSHFNTQTPLDARLFNLMGPASCWSGWPARPALCGPPCVAAAAAVGLAARPPWPAAGRRAAGRAGPRGRPPACPAGAAA